MKKIISILCLFVLFILSIQTTFAQAYQIYVSDINVTSEEYSVGGVVTGSFKLSNLSDIPQTDIYYSISAGNYSKDSLSFSNLQGESVKKGPYYIKAQAQDEISFQYTLPTSITGESALKITAILKDGTFVGESEYPIKIVGAIKLEPLAVVDSALLISDYDAVINPQTGPTVYDGESIDLAYAVSPSNVAMVLTPVLKLYDRVDNPETLKKVIEFDEINVSNQINTYSLSLPTDLDPLVYYGVLSFQDKNKSELFSTSLRYIIAGPIATVRNITTEALSVDKGDEFSAVVTYGGEPFDEYRPEKQIQLASSTITVTAKNEKGEDVATVSQLIDLKSPIKTITIPMKAQAKAESLAFHSVIKTQDGKVLDEYSTVLPTEDAVRHQKSLVQNNYSFGIAVISILIVLLLIVVVLLLKKKYHKINLPTVMFILFLLLGIGIFNLPKINATSLSTEAYDYLSGVTDWDDKLINSIMGWKVIQTERTIYSKGEDTDATVFNSEEDWGFDSFQITSVSSPYPPHIKIYEPGEKFKLSVNAVYGDCNNNPRHYVAYSYNPESKWWANKPKLNGEIADRMAYWEQASVGSLLFDFQGGKDFSDFKYLFKKTDLQVISPDMSDNKETALKDIVSKSALNWDDGYARCNECGDGFTAKLYRFADDGDASTSDYVSWIKNNYTKADSVQKTFLNLTKALDEYPAVSKFDFKDISNLKNGGNEFTDEYIKMLKVLNRRVYEYTKTPLEEFFNWFRQGTHDAELTAVTLNKTYEAPQEPGYHRVYFYLYQLGNSGERDITAVQVICVRGKGVCPNETSNTAPTVTLLPASEVKPNQAKVNWTYADKQGDKQIQYHIQLSTQKGFTDPSKIVDVWSGIGESADNNSVRSKVITNLKANTTYYVKMRAKSDSKDVPYWSNWTDGNYSFTTTKNGCDTSHTDGEIKCIDGKEYEYYCEDTTWKTKATGNTCGNNFSCVGGTYKVGSTATFTAKDISGVTYQWYIGSDLISGENSNVYKEKFNEEGSYTRKVKATYSDNTSDITSCTVNITQDGNNPSCPDGNCTGVDGDGGDGGNNALLKKMEFIPNTVDVDGYCKLYVEVENAKSCVLTKRGENQVINNQTLNSSTYTINGSQHSVGTYLLTCVGTNDLPSQLGTRSCYSNPDIREN
ncbi:MAG: hypothetical protein RLZZ517_446 [Candidatus Parcubacteria bacterium]|jgi:hypothetical protein